MTTKYVGAGGDYESWSDVVWASGTIYDGRGETVTEPIVIGADNVSVQNVHVYGGVSWTPSWSGPDGNGEYSAAAPTNSFGSGTTGRILFKDGEPIKKGGTVGSLAAGFWQFSGSDVYVKDDPAGSSFELVFNDDGISTASYTVRNGVTLENVSVTKTNNGVRMYRDSAVAPNDGCDDFTMIGCHISWSAQSALWLQMGNDARVEHNIFEHNGSTLVSFGSNISSAKAIVDGLIFRNNVCRDSCDWYTDTNVEGHQLDVLEGSENVVIEQNQFLRHGYYSGITTYPATGAYRPAATISIDGVSGCWFRENKIIDNYPGGIEIGNDAAGDSGATNQRIVANIFARNWRFTASADANHSESNTIHISFGSYDIDAIIAHNLFIENGNGHTHSVRPCAVYGVVNRDADVVFPTLVNNIFVQSNMYSEVMYRNLSTNAACAVTATVRNNIYYPYTDTNALFYEVDNATTYQVPNVDSFADLQAGGYDVGGQYGVDPKIQRDYWPAFNSIAKSAGVKLYELRDFNDRIYVDTPTVGPFEFYEDRSGSEI